MDNNSIGASFHLSVKGDGTSFLVYKDIKGTVAKCPIVPGQVIRGSWPIHTLMWKQKANKESAIPLYFT